MSGLIILLSARREALGLAEVSESGCMIFFERPSGFLQFGLDEGVLGFGVGE